MVNVLIADDNIDYAINLMNYINKQNTNARMYQKLDRNIRYS